ncbi:hypothetical protein HF325_006735 [Metschnikowia pulcherrima]|uniref:Uncharacterized protein n=1 Tax=Metschnikowia pulcherrima TaxID=27326 RepID=A0A8H7L8U9_9ASCO|nr:hypothetical protein HF325_006735 [Metschnikowia pulcherrima]
MSIVRTLSDRFSRTPVSMRRTTVNGLEILDQFLVLSLSYHCHNEHMKLAVVVAHETNLVYNSSQINCGYSYNLEGSGLIQY